MEGGRYGFNSSAAHLPYSLTHSLQLQLPYHYTHHQSTSIPILQFVLQLISPLHLINHQSPPHPLPTRAKPPLSPGSVFSLSRDHRPPEELNPLPSHSHSHSHPQSPIRIEIGSRPPIPITQRHRYTQLQKDGLAGSDERPKPLRLQSASKPPHISSLYRIVKWHFC
jgi:hypothetical protein